MHWFLISLIPPFLYALTNHSDKYLISKYFKHGEVGSLIIFSALFSVFALPVIGLFQPEVLELPWNTAALLAFNGMLTVLSILFYLYALHEDEASVVVPFYQTIPVFAFVLAFLILGETITGLQSVGSLLVLVGAGILSLNLEGETIKFRKKVALFMLAASLFYAINEVIFKLFALDHGFWSPLFWDFVGKVILGIMFFAFVKHYRQDFLKTIKENSTQVISLNSFSEIATIIADSVAAYAVLLAPVVLVSVALSAFQPVFVFVIGIGLTLLLPHLGKELLLRRSLIQKIIALILICGGSLLLL